MRTGQMAVLNRDQINADGVAYGKLVRISVPKGQSVEVLDILRDLVFVRFQGVTFWVNHRDLES